MSETVNKVGSVVLLQIVKRFMPLFLSACGGFVAASWPIYHAAFCQVN